MGSKDGGRRRRLSRNACPTEKGISIALCWTRDNARTRGVPFTLTREEYAALIFKPCAYCGMAPRNKIAGAKMRGNFCLLYQGVDRMDNERGYEPGNVAPCCQACNSIKGKYLSHPEMIQVARLLKKLRTTSVASASRSKRRRASR